MSLPMSSLSQLFDQVRQLFQREQTQQEAFVRENLERSPEEQEAYSRWLAQDREQAASLLRSRLIISADAQGHGDFYRLETPSTRGIVLHHPDRHFGEAKSVHVFDWLCEQIRGQGYYRQHADARSWLLDKGVERIERRHFKARFRYDESIGKSDQLFGNITLEHKLLDGASVEIKLINNTYHDRAWLPAQEFGQLLEAVLG